VERQSKDANHRLHHRVGHERIGEALGKARAPRRAGRHAAHEHHQHERLRVSGVAEEKLEVMRPDGFVDQAGESGRREKDVERAARHRARC
jgi:hypothetical protein